MEPWSRADPVGSPLDGPVVGLRLWSLDRSLPLLVGQTNGVLISTNATYVWKPGPQEAVCNRYAPPIYMGGQFGPKTPSRHYHGEGVPVNKCVCGFHAFYSFVDLCDFFSGAMKCMRKNTVCGIIRGWGKVHLHPNGWRSLYAEPMALFQNMFSNDDDIDADIERALLPRISEAYHIPILSPKAYPDILGEFGSVVPYELKPESQSGNQKP